MTDYNFTNPTIPSILLPYHPRFKHRDERWKNWSTHKLRDNGNRPTNLLFSYTKYTNKVYRINNEHILPQDCHVLVRDGTVKERVHWLCVSPCLKPGKEILHVKKWLEVFSVEEVTYKTPFKQTYHYTEYGFYYENEILIHPNT